MTGAQLDVRVHEDAAPTAVVAEQQTHRPEGRQRECEALDELVSALWTGGPQVLVLRGDEGIGKTVLLDYLAERATGCRVIRTTGVEPERDLAFAGLHQMCVPILDGLDQLPAPQRDALGVAFGLRAGEPSDRFVVGMAVTGLLEVAAAERPLVCIVKELQWLDEASRQILGFATRRLTAAPVAIVMAVCNRGPVPDLAGVPELAVGGLGEEQARSLLRSSAVGPLDVRVQDRITAEARGNPMALRQTAAGRIVEELAGGYGVSGQALPVAMEVRFRRRLALLPPVARQLLLLAAAEPTGDAVLLWTAATDLGLTADAAAPAVAVGLVELDGQVRFCHPLLRCVVHDAASPQQRRTVHRALADATDPTRDPDGHAWHRAQAAVGVDDAAAAELERTAGRAWDRGGWPAAAAFRARAAELTADPACRARRALAAAEAKHRAGFHRGARRLLAMAEAGSLVAADAARARLLDARLATGSGRGAHTSRLLLDAADGLDPARARSALRDALVAAMAAGRLDGMGVQDVGSVVGAASVDEHADAHAKLLVGMATLARDGHPAGAPMVEDALQTLSAGAADDDEVAWLPLAWRAAQAIWDDRAWGAVTTRLTDSARRSGALAVLQEALDAAAVIQLLANGCRVARPLVHEAEAVAQATGSDVAAYGRLLTLAWQGRRAELSSLTAEATPRLSARGDGAWLTAADLATAVANNSVGRYDDALAAAAHGAELPEELGFATWCLVELIEAAARLGDHERATRAVKELVARTDGATTEWAVGTVARALALVADDDAAEGLYLRAIQHLDQTSVRADAGRARLLYGEWLRRQGRRVDARDQLRSAHELLHLLGIDGFAERARRELVATGGTPRRRTPATADELTPQESQIARMAREGRSNTEIGVELYISQRTVEWHLRKVFMKLGISSRRQLDKALPA